VLLLPLLTLCMLLPAFLPLAVDRSKRPVDIPFELVPETQAEQLRHRLAVQKRGERLVLRDRMRQRKKVRVSLDGQTTDRWASWLTGQGCGLLWQQRVPQARAADWIGTRQC
jgi:hypothetical protein